MTDHSEIIETLHKISDNLSPRYDMFGDGCRKAIEYVKEHPDSKLTFFGYHRTDDGAACLHLIDLTEAFGEGKKPDEEEFLKMFKPPYYEYKTKKK